ncbi:MAG: acyltransferase [Bacteroidales bacterium]
MFFAHTTAVIDHNCQIGDNTKIWHFTHLMSGCKIGAACVLGQNVYIASTVVIGNRVKIQNNVSLYDGVICEDDVFLGPSCVFTNVLNPRSAVNRKDEYLPTKIEKGATIGANSTIICGHTIGKYAFIGAGSVITKNIPSYSLWTGNPAQQKGWVSEHGHKLNFDETGKAICLESGEEYLLSEGNVTRLK